MNNKAITSSQQSQSLIQALKSPAVYDRLKSLLGNPVFADRMRANLITLVSGNSYLQKCAPASILSAVGQAAAMNLSISPTLGQAYIVPYKDGFNYKAQFQIGTKGLIQLAMRSGQYKTINVDAVYEGEIKSRDRATGEISWQDRTSNEVVGYFAIFELTNGFRKTFYMSVEELKAHAEKYSQSYRYDIKNGKKTSPWTTNFAAMAEKTVLKLLISKFGIISIELENAIQADQAVISKDNDYRYIDNERRPIDFETVESEIDEDVIDDFQPVSDSLEGGTNLDSQS